ncbi:hypothetical protein GCM10009555_015970 [Acrocarpospora macrocephala]|uniref:DUF6879 domain-containing protein n=1 Tax=Acrocarpospora macrocephala TaxID=150177 RepID=A0A5M3XAD2_9ACTN|nr:DUF6879 family protein [Acrocarpospora macrocephala]GES15803.1 hypothetical protein Amac_094010 [Acrocarpospora macrocephala]
MLSHIAHAESQTLSSKGYLEDFWPYFRELKHAFWKLETYQNFREPEDASWRALDDGDWAEAVRLIDERRAEIQQPLSDAQGFTMRRLRIVDKPYTSYVQWELYYIRLRALAGEDIRVLESDSLPALGIAYRLPELVILDSVVMYEVLYTDDGTLSGARKIVDSALIDACRHEVEKLFEAGRELLPYMNSERSVLPPPLQHTSGLIV